VPLAMLKLNVSRVRTKELTRELMSARRAKAVAILVGDPIGKGAARSRVDKAKVALGERGPPWWTDEVPDLTRRMAKNTPYADRWLKQTSIVEPRAESFHSGPYPVAVK
jgi:hypothetical protein